MALRTLMIETRGGGLGALVGMDGTEGAGGALVEGMTVKHVRRTA